LIVINFHFNQGSFKKMKIKKYLSFTSLRKALSKCFDKIQETRQVKKIEYSIHDALMSGFACMHFQDASLLQFQNRLEKKHHKSNLQSLFRIHKIPESTQLRTITDEVDSSHFAPFFEEYFYRLQRGKHLKQYQLFKDKYLIPMDGTDYFSSNSVSCAGCLTTKSKKKTNKRQETNNELEEGDEGLEEIHYAHKALQVAIMHPDMRQVIPLMPEEIKNTDGATKQDCEINAAKRLLPKLRKAHPQLGIIITGDDLFSRQPMIEATIASGMQYIYVAKPTSHTYLNEWLSVYPKLHRKEIYDAKKDVRHCYEWMNEVPLNGGKEALQVNYFQYQMLTKNKKGKEIIGYQNSWVTDIEVTEENIETLVRGGRCKWKIENECFNTLKNQGYCIEHNYGHGEKNLSFNFYLLTLMAFAFHQVFELTDKLYQTCRRALGSKKNLWDTIRAYIRILIFDTWEAVLNFTLNPENYLPERMPALS
jgi:hypothetical protein